MAKAARTSITRRSVVAGLTLTATPVAVLAGRDNAYAQAKQTTSDKSLYDVVSIRPWQCLPERLNGVP